METEDTVIVHAGLRWRLFPGKGWESHSYEGCQWPSTSEDFLPLILIGTGGTKSLKAAGRYKTRQQNKINSPIGPWSLAGTYQEERNLVSLSHDAGPGSLYHRGSQSHLTQLPFSWGSLFLHSCTLGNVSGEPLGRATSCQDDAVSERTTEAGSGIPGDRQEESTCARIVIAMRSTVTKNLKHLKCWSIGNHLNKLRYSHTKEHYAIIRKYTDFCKLKGNMNTWICL